MGIIVRTAGLNRNKAELQRDMAYLQRLWASIEDKSQQSPAPALIYQEQDLVIRSIRDYFTPDIQEVLVDDREVYYRARDFFQAVMPRYHGRVKLYREKKPLFAKYQLEEQLETVYSHKVLLKQGGSIVIDQTEALVAIDVNSGRATREKTIEETAFKTNTEAAQEVARQLRLRDLGGLIVIDFIDMRNPKHNQEIEKTFRQSVKRDKARTQVGRISQFGLLELSRQRLKPTILEGNYQNCPHCEGSGLVRSTVAFALSVLRQIRAEAAKDTLAAVNAKLPMDVAFYLLNQKRKEIAQLEEAYSLTLNLVGNPLARQNEHSLDFIRRPASEEKAPAVEKAPAREVRESPSRSASGGAPRRRGRGARAATAAAATPEAAAPAPKPEEGAEAAAPQPVALDAVAPPVAAARGRVFWRFNSASRRLETHDNGEAVAAKRPARGPVARRRAVSPGGRVAGGGGAAPIRQPRRARRLSRKKRRRSASLLKRRRSDRPGASDGVQFQQAAGDDLALHLAGALADGEQLGVPVVALHGKLLRVAVAAVNLDAFRGRLLAHLAGEELGHPGLQVAALAAVLLGGGLVGQQPRGLDRRRHVRQLELDRLEGGDALPRTARGSAHSGSSPRTPPAPCRRRARRC